MRLLFDQNLSYRLPRRLADLYPESLHVRYINLLGADDRLVWQHAKENGPTIVSKDSDFNDLAVRLAEGGVAAARKL